MLENKQSVLHPSLQRSHAHNLTQIYNIHTPLSRFTICTWIKESFHPFTHAPVNCGYTFGTFWKGSFRPGKLLHTVYKLVCNTLLSCGWFCSRQVCCKNHLTWNSVWKLTGDTWLQPCYGPSLAGGGLNCTLTHKDKNDDTQWPKHICTELTAQESN